MHDGLRSGEAAGLVKIAAESLAVMELEPFRGLIRDAEANLVASGETVFVYSNG